MKKTSLFKNFIGKSGRKHPYKLLLSKNKELLQIVNEMDDCSNTNIKFGILELSETEFTEYKSKLEKITQEKILCASLFKTINKWNLIALESKYILLIHDSLTLNNIGPEYIINPASLDMDINHTPISDNPANQTPSYKGRPHVKNNMFIKFNDIVYTAFTDILFASGDMDEIQKEIQKRIHPRLKFYGYDAVTGEQVGSVSCYFHDGVYFKFVWVEFKHGYGLSAMNMIMRLFYKYKNFYPHMEKFDLIDDNTYENKKIDKLYERLGFKLIPGYGNKYWRPRY